MRFPAPLQALDLAGLRLTRTLGHTPALERAVRSYSLLGQYSAGWLAIGAAGVVLDRPRRGRWARALAGVGVAYVANQTIKFAVRRPRPQLDDLPQLMHTPTQLSFPSAHATSSFAAAHAYAGLLPAGPLRIAAWAMAGSRLYLGVHWPSDIVIGAALGTAIGKGART
ncbi:phosphatase PAP2 family protein [Conexibacter woesei]|uniref:phosphatase PAP2 family protein n=1 Tax=Conexibacter woesei TaxID=191495 RepID=UPI0005A05B44|nr:phosphatase PAP2 family protein [Conexibacter woesei]